MDRMTHLRKLVEEAQAGRIPDKWWEYLVGRHYVSEWEVESRSDDDLRDDAAAIAEHWESIPAELRASRAGSDDLPEVSPEPPEWWKQESYNLYESVIHYQEKARHILNLDAPIAAEDVGSFVLRRCSTERWEGEYMMASYPAPDGREVFYPLHQGCRDDELPALVAEMGIEAAVENINARTQPMWRVNTLAEAVAAEIGVPVHHALGFLLSGKRYVRPWIIVRAHLVVVGKERWSDEGVPPWERDKEPPRLLSPTTYRFEITVGSPDVKPAAVAAAYQQALEERKLKPRARPGRSQSKNIMGAWVLEQRRAEPSLKWPKLWQRWHEALEADKLPEGAIVYKNPRSMSSAFGEWKRRQGGAS